MSVLTCAWQCLQQLLIQAQDLASNGNWTGGNHDRPWYTAHAQKQAELGIASSSTWPTEMSSWPTKCCLLLSKLVTLCRTAIAALSHPRSAKFSPREFDQCLLM